MAAALLALERFEEAYQAATKAVENYHLGDAEKFKASFRFISFKT
jgi:hypothetical protein